jgi:hypothetical protein
VSTDSSDPIQGPKSPDLWRLPEILDVRTRRHRFDPPRRVTVAGDDRFVTDAIAVDVELSEPFQIRALGPVLWIGNEPLVMADVADDGISTFYAFVEDRLQEGAPIALAWGNNPSAPRTETRFRYTAP